MMNVYVIYVMDKFISKEKILFPSEMRGEGKSPSLTVKTALECFLGKREVGF